MSQINEAVATLAQPQHHPSTPRSPLNLLAYVHLRNIHGSTGAGRTARQITEHLAMRKDISLRILADVHDKDRILPLVEQPWTGFRFCTFKRDTSAQQARWFLFDRPRAEDFWPEADVVFCTGESYVPVRKAALVMTAHDAGYFETQAHRRDAAFWRTRIKWELLFRKLARKVDLFHTVSAFSAERLAHFFPRISPRIRVVHNGVAPLFFAPVQASGHQYLLDAGLNTRPFVLVPGGLHFRKNAELILAAIPLLLARFPGLLICVVNHTNPVYAEKAKLLGSRVRLLGFVSDEALHALYTAASVVWFPSRYEGFGLPVVEAMACGAPVVASNTSSIPEIAGNAGILVDATSPVHHADAITALLADSKAREQQGALGRQRAATFTWARCADQLAGHLRSLR